MTRDALGFTGSEFQAWYNDLQPTLEKRLFDFCTMLRAALKNEFDEPLLQRIVLQSGRVKKTARAWEKLGVVDADIPKLEDIPRHIFDLIGTRIVCTNISDLEQVKDYLFSLPLVTWGDNTTNTLSVLDGSYRDYVSAPKPSGYRSVHVTLAHRFPVFSGHDFATCEVQARTILQNA